MDVWKRWTHYASIQISIIKSGKKGEISWQAGIIQYMYLSKCHTTFILDALIYSETLWVKIDSQEAFSTINL